MQKARGVRELRGVVAVVTGGASGIGLATVGALAAAGARVALLDRDRQRAQDRAAEFQAAGHKVMAFTCDVTDPASCRDALFQVAQDLGDVGLLVNNAGIAHRSLFADTTVDVLKQVMAVNYFGALHVTAAALPMLRRTRGAIAVVSSVAGFAPLVGRTGYAASKHALHGFFDSLRTEEAPHGIDITLVCPSFTRTAIEDNALSGTGGRVTGARATTGSLALPEDIAAALVRGVQRRQPRVLPTALSRMAWWMSRVAPGAYARIMYANQQHEFPSTTQELRQQAALETP